MSGDTYNISGGTILGNVGPTYNINNYFQPTHPKLTDELKTYIDTSLNRHQKIALTVIGKKYDRLGQELRSYLKSKDRLEQFVSATQVFGPVWGDNQSSVSIGGFSFKDCTGVYDSGTHYRILLNEYSD